MVFLQNLLSRQHKTPNWHYNTLSFSLDPSASGPSHFSLIYLYHKCLPNWSLPIVPMRAVWKVWARASDWAKKNSLDFPQWARLIGIMCELEPFGNLCGLTPCSQRDRRRESHRRGGISDPAQPHRGDCGNARNRDYASQSWSFFGSLHCLDQSGILSVAVYREEKDASFWYTSQKLTSWCSETIFFLLSDSQNHGFTSGRKRKVLSNIWHMETCDKWVKHQIHESLEINHLNTFSNKYWSHKQYFTIQRQALSLTISAGILLITSCRNYTIFKSQFWFHLKCKIDFSCHDLSLKVSNKLNEYFQ